MWIVHKAYDILLSTLNICCGQFFTKLVHERFPVDDLAVKFADAFLKMDEVEGNVPTYIPFEIIPVASLYPVLPGAVDQCMHLACIKIGQGKTTRHKRIGLLQNQLLGIECQRRVGIQLYLHLHALLRLESNVVSLCIILQESRFHTTEVLLFFPDNAYLMASQAEFLYDSREIILNMKLFGLQWMQAISMSHI